VLKLPVWELAIRDGVGGRLGSVITVFAGRRRTGRATPETRIGIDGYADFRLPIERVRAGVHYRVRLDDINDIHGNVIARTALVVGRAR
jgi:hypothetical protein